MNRDVLSVVVSMVGIRRIRNALGYSVDTCIKERIPPCELSLDWSFGNRLCVFYSTRSNRYYERVTVQKESVTESDVMCTTVTVSYKPNVEEYQVEILKEVNKELWQLRTYVIGRFERTTEQYFRVFGGNA